MGLTKRCVGPLASLLSTLGSSILGKTGCDDGYDGMSLIQLPITYSKDPSVEQSNAIIGFARTPEQKSASIAHAALALTPQRRLGRRAVPAIESVGFAVLASSLAEDPSSHLGMHDVATAGLRVPMLAALRNASVSWRGPNVSDTTWSVHNSLGSETEMDARQPIDLVPAWEIKQAIADAVEEGIKKAEDEAAANKTQVSVNAIKEAVNEKVFGGWEHMKNTVKANRFKRRSWTGSQKQTGFIQFFTSVEIMDWIILLIFVAVFLAQHYFVLSRPSSRTFHTLALLMWVLAAALYNFLIFQRMGTAGGILWLNGYILEMVFLVENVLVCHIIISAFRTPRFVNEKALFIVVACRILFQMGFYMGLAELVFSGQVLPYILGLWLLYVAYQSAMDDENVDFDIMDTRAVHLARAIFGDRLSLARDDSGAMFQTENKIRLSMSGLMVCCLVLVDFLLHVDVALTKIEELGGNAFICFSSAALAAFTLPELIFVMRDLFRRFPGLKYGISLVLVYIAAQMILHQVWWPPISMDLIIWVALLVLSAAMPVAVAGWRGGKSAGRGVDAGSQASFVAGNAALPRLSVGELQQ